MAWLGLYGFAWNDYENEAQSSVQELIRGHVLQFLHTAPVYGGSLLERAPFALLPSLWGGDQLAVYRMLALPCLLALALLGMALVAHVRTQDGSPLVRVLALGLCVANPLVLIALEVGHPEELLGGCLCVTAVVLASRGRALWAALLLGLAIAGKQWAVLALGPALLACPLGKRVLLASVTIVVASAVLAPFAIFSAGSISTNAQAVATPGSIIFQPWQLWWFFGHHGALVHGLFGAPKPGYRIAADWAAQISHPSILLAGALVWAAMWRKQRRQGQSHIPLAQALLALALILLLRCVLDTWDTGYYLVPFLLALLSWRVYAAPREMPLPALAATLLAWLVFQGPAARMAPDDQALLFLAWTAPLAAYLAYRLLAEPTVSLVDEREILGQGREPLVSVLAHNG